ncbi:hypothetical protein HU200_056854 [Digitaria exilis]|uniref:F-box domain-containing protein n=1 Tax=Digitaria exilis TaxID=1010633 RepID=A0A835AGH5_9POAL|nr:hypothetical protein HU200_056854 [Digitaria exilis]
MATADHAISIHPTPTFSPYEGSLATSGVNRCDINRLPIDFLSKVLQRLPLKEAARTAVVSHRWRDVWRHAISPPPSIGRIRTFAGSSLASSGVNSGEAPSVFFRENPSVLFPFGLLSPCNILIDFVATQLPVKDAALLSDILTTQMPVKDYEWRSFLSQRWLLDLLTPPFSLDEGGITLPDVDILRNGEDRICCLPVNGGEDRISRLPDELLSSIVTRLPLKDAARTAVLSPRWRHVWVGCVAASDIKGVEDRISRLPSHLLSNIITHLPIKDAARTPALSHRWRRVWASTPLVLDDADLFPDNCVVRWRTITDAVSCVLAAHQGPFLSIRLTHSFYLAVTRDMALARKWLRVLADKGVERLELFNYPDSTFTSLPSEILCMASLCRLDLRHWDFPSTDVLIRGVNVFPRLRELRLCEIHFRTVDIDRLLQYSPELEFLVIIASDGKPPTVRIRNCNLKCVIFWMSVADMFQVLLAPSLERLILWSKKPDGQPIDDFPIRLNIGYAPNLNVLGYLDPKIHILEIGSTIIESGGDDEPIGEFNFWVEAIPIRCLQSTLRKVVFKNYHGYDSELAFLRFIWERAHVLEKLVVDLAGRDDPALIEEVATKLKSKVCGKRIWKNRKAMVVLRTGGSNWSLSIASNLTLSDPFDF